MNSHFIPVLFPYPSYFWINLIFYTYPLCLLLDKFTFSYQSSWPAPPPSSSAPPPSPPASAWPTWGQPSKQSIGENAEIHFAQLLQRVWSVEMIREKQVANLGRGQLCFPLLQRLLLGHHLLLSKAVTKIIQFCNNHEFIFLPEQPRVPLSPPGTSAPWPSAARPSSPAPPAPTWTSPSGCSPGIQNFWISIAVNRLFVYGSVWKIETVGTFKPPVHIFWNFLYHGRAD